ncbi:2-dehydropantoate 2-reductase [Burkholderia sp. FERM BP-3421]|uniref:2-dehydropantoate 2-reductase n=1 Tax=Burkholderia sp. FERM BP-3421 TaxID=1494466 RepID=UPI002361C04F|nr:2-dehydropantoate 2-reductase [Burkholderia sp. FERM BP-3421]WDD95057.1 2-dehydropantoate 2-reductase [Burkholderia sp. FERM BP-3421]
MATEAPIGVYGAGAIGCYLGGRLLAGGADVTLVGRARIGAALGEQGLALSDHRGRSARVPPERIRFATEAAALADAALVLVTVKSAATPEAAAALAPVLQRDAVVISFQNGLGNADRLAAAMSGRTVLAGMVQFNVVARGPGAFHQGSAGALEVAAAPALRRFMPAFARAGLPLRTRADLRPVQWAKLLFNLNNAINALADLPLRDELAQRSYRRCLALAQREALDVFARLRMRPARLTPLPAAWLPALLASPDALFTRLAGRMLAIDPLARSSMADDLAAGRPTEVEWINGEIVRLAREAGCAAPVNQRLCALVHAAEAARTRPAWRGAELLDALRAAGEARRPA